MRKRLETLLVARRNPRAERKAATKGFWLVAWLILRMGVCAHVAHAQQQPLEIIHRAAPEYPQLARQSRIQGAVTLNVVIGADGSVESATVVNGHPMLAQAAVEAVKQWKYKPYLIDGKPTQVQSQVQLNFNLAGEPESPPPQWARNAAPPPPARSAQPDPASYGMYTTDLDHATEYCRTHPENDLERSSVGGGMCEKVQRAAAYCKNRPDGGYGFIACPGYVAALARKKAEDTARAKTADEAARAESNAQAMALNQKILWCEGQSLDTPVDPSGLGFKNARDSVGLNCRVLLEWVARTQPAKVGQAFLRKAAQTDPVARQRLEAWEAEQARLKAEDLRLWKLHDSTRPLLHVGQTQAQAKAILTRQGFDPWRCDQLGDDVVVKQPGQLVVGCTVSSRGKDVFLLAFIVSERNSVRDPDTTKITTREVKVDRMTQIVELAQHHNHDEGDE